MDVQDDDGSTRHLSVGAGKDSLIYVVDRDSMGKFNPTTDQIYQEISGQLGGSVFSMPAYFNGAVYYGAVGDADRKSTRLNSSHTVISYAVFCLKKKRE